MKLGTVFQRFFCYYMLICLVCVCKEASCLRCYSCHYKNLLADCLNSEITCGFGETCLNVVYRRPVLGIVYSKGCQDRSKCQNLERLNHDRLCYRTPSECVYCCDGDLCNDANSIATSHFVVAFFVMCSLWLCRTIQIL